MISELSFLISLLLEHRLLPSVKKVIAERIKEVEAKTATPGPRISNWPIINTTVSVPPDPKTAQAPSTQRILDEMAASAPVAPPADPAPQPVVTSPVVAQALSSRAQLLRGATSKKGPIVDEETGRPRKF